MRKNIFLIIGDGKCGKSSLVRALTGVYRAKAQLVAPTNGQPFSCSVWPQSCQEAGDSPIDVLNEVGRNPHQNFLITLRFFPGPEMIKHDAIEYYDLLNANHNIQQVLFMGSTNAPNTFNVTQPMNILPNSLNNAVNENASIVRQLWGWR